MTSRRTRLFAPVLLAGLFAPVLLAGLLVSCSPATPVADPDAEEIEAPTLPAEDEVALTVYFRDGDGESAHLVRVSREVPVADDLPRRAVELLIAGPRPEDGDLEAPLPTTTEVRDVRVEGHIAEVDLSAEVIADADQVGASPANEALALGALADTLTEFPEIDQVRLSVEGRTSGPVDEIADVSAFWGGWGLPEVLVRDESLVEPESEDAAVPDLEAFVAEPQVVGSDEADPVEVRQVSTRDRTTYLRVVVELADAHDEDTAAAVPPARAWTAGDSVMLELHEVAGHDPEKVRLDPVDSAFADVDAEFAEERLRVTVTPREGREFALSTLTSPVRLVLDIRK